MSSDRGEYFQSRPVYPSGMKYRKFTNQDVKNTFNSYPKIIRDKLMFVREMIFNLAQENSNVGNIDETLKWETPSYLTCSPKSGTTIRLAWLRSNPNKYAISVHCQTTLVAEFKELYPELEYDGNRSIILEADAEIPERVVSHFINAALSYHYRKKKAIGI